MSKRLRITTTLYCTEQYRDADERDPPEGAREFISWLHALIEKVPAEFRANATIVFDDDGDYDSPRPELTVSWWRDETDAEMREREIAAVAESARRQRSAEAQEKSLYLALKRKYETA